MLVIGGRSNNVGKTLAFEIYDTETSDWYKFYPIQRFRHSSCLVEQFLYLHGGFDSDRTEGILRVDLNKRFAQTPQLIKQMNTIKADQLFTQSFNPKPSLPLASTQDQLKKTNQTASAHQKLMSHIQIRLKFRHLIRISSAATIGISKYVIYRILTTLIRQLYNFKLQQKYQIGQLGISGFDLWSRRRYNQSSQEDTNRQIIRGAQKLGPGFLDPNSQNKSQIQDQLCQPFILFIDFSQFQFINRSKKEMIIKLCNEVQRILEKEPSLLRLRRPIKIYGNLNGQYLDLMRFFDHFKAPYDNLYNGDFDSLDYLFFGDYVDRGSRSLEIILLLFTLKIKYTDQIHLLRGHHKDSNVNKVFVFANECFIKFAEDYHGSGYMVVLVKNQEPLMKLN